MIHASDTGAVFDGVGNEQLFSDGKTAVICTRCDAHFLTDNLVLIDQEKSYSIQSVDGVQRGVGKLNMQALNITRAARATRFAYMTGHYVGNGFPIQSHFASLTGKIIVRDWNTNRLVADLDINEPAGNPSAGLAQMALALSPDGKHLAVLVHHTLSLYRLP
jgi:hypothetical protein